MGVRAKSRTKYAVIQQGQNRRSNDQHGQLKQSAHSAQAKTKRHNIYRRNSAKRLESCAAERMTEGSAHWPWSSPYSWCQRRRLPCQTTRATPARRWPRPPARSTARSTTPRRCAPTSGSSYSSRKTWRSVARLVRQRVHQRQQLGVQIRIAQRIAQRSSNDSSNVAMPSGVRRVAKVGANAVENRGHEHVHPVLQEPVRVEAITEYDDLTSPCRWDFSWRAWRPLKRRPPAAPRQCRAAEHSPNATTKTRNERPGRTGSGHEITSE